MPDAPDGPPPPADTLTVLTWNINSIRAREALLAKVIRQVKPDVIVLQETRVDDGAFPTRPWRRRGYRFILTHGRGGHHGVALLSKRPLGDPRSDVLGGLDQPRHLSATVDFGGPLRLHSLYVPSGGDEPDAATNAKFAHKLAYLDEMAPWGERAGHERAIVTGDFNVAPLEHDVWSHAHMRAIISHTPAERSRLSAAQTHGGWVDVMRRDRPEPEKLHTWWSYRNRTWPGSDRGRRLDHVWASQGIAPMVVGVSILRDVRGWDKPSDHVPLLTTLALR